MGDINDTGNDKKKALKNNVQFKEAYLSFKAQTE